MAVQFGGEPNPQSHALEWLEAIEQEASDDLTDWEGNFLDSVGRTLRDGRELTGPQLEILEGIYAENTP